MTAGFTCAPEMLPIIATMNINAKPTYIDDKISDANNAASVKMNVPITSAITMLIKLFGNLESSSTRLLLAVDSVTTYLTVVLVSVLAAAVFFSAALTGAFFEVFFVAIFPP